MSNTSPTAAPLEDMTVQELQSIAAEAATARRPAPRRALSRAARLNLIDQLSRWGGSGLALFAGVSIFIMIVIARGMPLRSTIWAAMIFASLYLCRRYRKGFRRGDHIASHPFRWRAYYAATLAVVSAAFGAGAFLILPDSVSPGGVMQTLALMLVAATGAAAFHLTHRPSAAAAGLPAFTAIAGAASVSFGLTAFTLGVLATGLAAAAFVIFASAEAQRRAGGRFPRTTFVRREIEDRPYSRAQPATTRAAS